MEVYRVVERGVSRHAHVRVSEGRGYILYALQESRELSRSVVERGVSRNACARIRTKCVYI